jgi:hypothetical protein
MSPACDQFATRSAAAAPASRRWAAPHTSMSSTIAPAHRVSGLAERIKNDLESALPGVALFNACLDYLRHADVIESNAQPASTTVR